MIPLAIRAVGFEIEGEFSHRLMEAMREHGEMGGDGSIHECRRTASYAKNHAIARVELDQIRAYEYRSRVFQVPHDTRRIASVFSLLEKYRKLKQFHWNTSMGFHVHVSFNRKPIELWSRQFYLYFRSRLSEVMPGVITRRARNQYCRLPEDRDDQSIAHSSAHYEGISFLAPYREHGTFEFRIFPSAAPRTMKRYLGFTLDTIKAFIRNDTSLLTCSYDALFGEQRFMVREFARPFRVIAETGRNTRMVSDFVSVPPPVEAEEETAYV